MRPLNPFFRFSNDLRRTLKDVGNRKATDVVVELAALWRGADDAKKAIYQLEYEKDMVILIHHLIDRVIFNVCVSHLE